MEDSKELEDILRDEEYSRLPRGLLLYHKNSVKVENDIYVRGATEGWLRKLDIYKNVFNTVESLYYTLIRMRYRVGYGYFKVRDGVFKRGVFLIKDSYVIDINRQFYRTLTGMEYITFVELDIQDYIKVIISTNGDIVLENYFREYEGLWLDYVIENGYKILR